MFEVFILANVLYIVILFHICISITVHLVFPSIKGSEISLIPKSQDDKTSALMPFTCVYDSRESPLNLTSEKNIAVINFRKLRGIIGTNIDFSSRCHPCLWENFIKDVVYISLKKNNKVVSDIFLPLFNDVLCESLFIQQVFIEYLYVPGIILGIYQ